MRTCAEFVYEAWSIRGFPRKIRQVFVGECKKRGKNVSDELEFIISRYIRECRETERKEDAQTT
jgi:hypothetical protein